MEKKTPWDSDCIVPLVYVLITGKGQQGNDNDLFVQNASLFGSGWHQSRISDSFP